MFPRTLFGFYWSVIRKFAFPIAASFIVGLLSYFVDSTLFPFTTKWSVEIFESAINGVWSNKFYWIMGVYVAIMVFGILRAYIDARFSPLVGRYIDFTLYQRVYDNDIDFFITHPAGQITNHIGAVSKNFEEITLTLWQDIIKYTIGILFISGTMLALSWKIGLLIIVVALVRGGWRFLTQRRINRQSKILQDVNSELGGVRTDSLANAITVKLFSHVEYEGKYIYNRQQERIKLNWYIAFLRRIQSIPAQVLWFGALGAVMLLSIHMMRNGLITVADGVFAFASCRHISGTFQNLMLTLVKYSEKKSVAVHAFENIIVPRTVTDAPGARKLRAREMGVDFDNVSFDYGKGRVLSNFDLVIKPGERVGIVGLSGAGKTTLVHLLLRMYDVKSGAICVAGTDVRNITQDSLRKSISFVPQESVLFNRTILENIRYGRPTATRAAVIAAAKKANIHDFIISQADGYDTLVGNRGIKLSGGQRQRIAIARAILKDAPILVLDEATSALDSKNEILIQGALAKIMRGKTTIAIAHRLSTLRNMDRIVVMQRGKIIEQGSHTALLRRGGVYKKLWSMQGGEFFK